MKDSSNLFSKLSVVRRSRLLLWSSFLVIVVYCSSAAAQTTAFTYQGKLANNGSPATGDYDFQFKLFDAVSGGNQIGITLTLDGNGANPSFVSVTNGIFTVTLDFGNCPACFAGAPRFLEIAVKPHGAGSFPSPLTPRQAITSTPYAVKSLISANSTNSDSLSAACVNCVSSSQIASVNGSAVSGTIPVSSVPAGSTNYIQNSPTHQPQALFDISSGHFTQSVRIEGSGFIVPNTPSLSLSSSGSVQVDAPFLPGGRFAILENGNVGIGNGAPGEKLSVAGNGSFTGNVNAGTQYNIAGERAFIIYDPFLIGATDTFAGSLAGLQNLAGRFNSFFGCGAGQSNTNGNNNSFFGCGAGGNNILGSENTFVGRNAGFANTSTDNSFFGSFAGAANALGFSNSFFGKDAGKANSNGVENAFFGRSAGEANTLGNHNSFFGVAAGLSNTTEINNTFIGYNAGSVNGTNDSGNTASNNTFIGVSAGLSNQTGSKITALGAFANVGAANLTNATAIGADALVTLSNSLVLGSNANVGIGTSAPTHKLEVFGNAQINGSVETSFLGVATAAPTAERLAVGGIIRVDGLGAVSPTGSHLCLNNSNQISPCAPSSIRYKTNITSYRPGLSIAKLLRPVNFNWKVDGTTDFGLVAEEVAKIEPLLVTHNKDGNIEGVQYDRIGVVLINAVKEQQHQIEEQQRLINVQQKQIDDQQKMLMDLRILVCKKNPRARLCR